MASALYSNRRRTNGIAVSLCYVAVFIGLGILAIILTVLIWKGLAGLRLSVFTEMTPPPGSNGGLLNAIYGSLVMTIIGVAIGTPLGMPRSLMITRVAYRAASAGLTTGVLLAVARVSGETAPLLFTSLNNQFFSTDLNAPMASLPAVIFQFALSPYEDWQQLAWTGALIITFAVLALSISARILASQGTQR